MEALASIQHDVPYSILTTKVQCWTHKTLPISHTGGQASVLKKVTVRYRKRNVFYYQQALLEIIAKQWYFADNFRIWSQYTGISAGVTVGETHCHITLDMDVN